MDFGFDSETQGFETEIEETLVRQVKRFDRTKRAKPGGSINCTPVIYGGTAYFGACDGCFYAVDAISGKERWRFEAGGMFLANFPVVRNDVIYVCCSDGYAYAISPEGRVIWKFRTGGPIFSTKPALGGGKIYLGSTDGYMYCLGEKTGEEIWRFKTGGEIQSSPTLYDNKLFAGSFDQNFYCIDAITGKEIWRFRMGAEIMNEQYNPIYNGRIYFAGFDNYLYCVDAETGKEVWRFRTGEYGNSAGPEMANGMLIHASRDGNLFALDPDTGKEIWKFRAEMGIFSGVLVHDNMIYFGCEDGNLYTLGFEGKELWRFRTGGPVYHFPAVWNNTLYFGSWDCHLYAVDIRTHEEMWRFATGDSSPAYLPPSKEMFRLEIKKEMHIEDAISEDRYKSKKKGDTVSLSDYQIESEYSSQSEYRSESDYDVQFTMFDVAMEVENTWISDLKASSPRISRQN